MNNRYWKEKILPKNIKPVIAVEMLLQHHPSKRVLSASVMVLRLKGLPIK